MERRTLLKALFSIPSLVVAKNGEVVGQVMQLDPQGRYVVILNGHMMDVETFCSTPQVALPAGTPIYVVHPNGYETIDDAIRIYKVGE